jgi:hypothetical protein
MFIDSSRLYSQCCQLLQLTMPGVLAACLLPNLGTNTVTVTFLYTATQNSATFHQLYSRAGLLS